MAPLHADRAAEADEVLRWVALTPRTREQALARFAEVARTLRAGRLVLPVRWGGAERHGST